VPPTVVLLEPLLAAPAGTEPLELRSDWGCRRLSNLTTHCDRAPTTNSPYMCESTVTANRS
jgi:hypothetical protein